CALPIYEAPINLIYSQRNRSAICRIPVYSKSPKAKRIEFRAPDPSSNGYLTFAALLMAGLDGVKNKIEPPKPMDVDLYELEPDGRKHVKNTPGSLSESLAALEADHDFLLQGSVFTKDVIETWLSYKRAKEVDPVALRPHPYEFFLYYDVGGRLCRSVEDGGGRCSDLHQRPLPSTNCDQLPMPTTGAATLHL